MRREALTISAIILLIMSVGCSYSYGSTTKPSQNIEQIKYRVGTQGLVLSFLPNAPPLKIYEGDPLSIIVEISNKGAFDVNDGRIYVSGYDPQFIRLNRESNSISNLEGKSFFNPEGIIFKTYEFEDPSVSIPDNVEKFPQTFVATACYRYMTKATPEICIDPDPFSMKVQEKVCLPRSVGLESQGAPVAVSMIEEELTRGRVQFKIHVKNVGDGIVFDTARGVANCHSDLDIQDINKVYITSVEFSGHEIRNECQPNPIRLNNGAGVAYCTYDGNLGESAFLTVLNVDLDYGYRSSISTATEIYEIP
jgi:hypothetical protein